jgi:hypothetical protein
MTPQVKKATAFMIGALDVLNSIPREELERVLLDQLTVLTDHARMVSEPEFFTTELNENERQHYGHDSQLRKLTVVASFLIPEARVLTGD